MTIKTSSTIEDYLGLIYITERDGDAITGTRLAELLAVSAPTVTNTLKRMVRDGLITMDANHCPHLTPRGDQLARTVMRRHMLAEWMLIRMLSWSKVHHEAHGFEHTISDEVENALLLDLNQPETCPHGNPLPGHEDAVSAWVPLTELKAGDNVTIRRIHELAEDIPELLAFLEEKRIEPGQEVKVVEVLPFNQTVTLDVLNNSVTLGFATAKQIFAEV
ncbi:MAG: metal-dependent transcriptional regulator [Chloroflexi bacterium HGW-Chloroflexi-5]|jgi:DtxR family Mn-dependent transcriptional regulator|nr:MAG: metal-dependent transcriptional regulator [Chloroflexi bacterium HGW-Chloroflexi-5]